MVKEVAARAGVNPATSIHWLAYVKASGELGALIKQVNIILNATSFFKLPGS